MIFPNLPGGVNYHFQIHHNDSFQTLWFTGITHGICLRASPSLELLGNQQQSHGLWGSRAATNCYFQYRLTCRPISCFANKMWLMENARYSFIKTQGDVFKCSEKQQTFTPEMPEQANV